MRQETRINTMKRVLEGVVVVVREIQISICFIQKNSLHDKISIDVTMSENDN